MTRTSVRVGVTHTYMNLTAALVLASLTVVGDTNKLNPLLSASGTLKFPMLPKLHFYLSASPKFPNQPSVLDRWRSEVRGRGLLLQTEKLFVHFPC